MKNVFREVFLFNKNRDLEVGVETDEVFESETERKKLASVLQSAEEELSSYKTHKTPSDPKLIEADRVLKKVTTLNDNVNRVANFSAQSSKEMNSIVQFMETAIADIEMYSKLFAENKEYQAQILKLTSEQRRMQQELESDKSQINTLREKGNEVQTVLRETRGSIDNMRHSNKKISDKFKVTLLENSDLTKKLAETKDACENLQVKLDVLESQHAEQKNELNNASKHVVQLEVLILEKDNIVSVQTEKAKILTTDLCELTKRFNELQNENNALKSRVEQESENLEHMKSMSVQDQRRHDNEVYAVRSELENTTSQWRHSQTEFKEISSKMQTLRERCKAFEQHNQKLESELEIAQELREKYQNDTRNHGNKVHELNLRYEAVLIDLKKEQSQTVKLNKKIKEISGKTQKTENLLIAHQVALEENKELKALVQAYLRNQDTLHGAPDIDEEEEPLDSNVLRLIVEDGEDNTKGVA